MYIHGRTCDRIIYWNINLCFIFTAMEGSERTRIIFTLTSLLHSHPHSSKWPEFVFLLLPEDTLTPQLLFSVYWGVILEIGETERERGMEEDAG